MKHVIIKTINTFILLLIATNFTYAQKKQLPITDLANVKYGEHDRNVFDIWFADTTKTTPLAIYIHGGSFLGGSKEKIRGHELEQLLEAGISVASINYRYKSIAPLPAAHYDAKQALQFIRSNAAKWKINKDRVATWGHSAGAQICMWLAFSDDMANPESANPIERESTRLTCVGSGGGQTTMESDFWREHLARYNIPYQPQDPRARFGVETQEEANEIAKSISALSLISADDPPIFMDYFVSPTDSLPSKNDPKKLKSWIVHHVIFGIELKEKMDELNIESYLKYPGAETKYKSVVEFFEDKLLEK